jgi:cell division protein FtsW
MPLTISRQITLLVILFLFLGQIMLFSATAISGLQKYGSEFYYVFKQGLTASIGILWMLIISNIHYRLWQKVSYILLISLIVILTLTLISPLGHHAQGASRWIRIGFLSFQPSELSKIILPIHLAYFLSSFKLESNSKKRLIGHCGLILTLLILIYKQPDLGSTVIALNLILSLLFISGIKFYYLFSGLLAGGIFTTLAIALSDYRKRRFLAFVDPWADPQGIGFQTIQSLLSIHSGKFFGVGIGNGNSKLFYLPEVHTDFIFSLIGEETGFLGACTVIFLFGYFSYLVFKVSFISKDLFGRYLAFGLSFILVLQICINLGGVTGLVPVKGLPLPFISWGRSALLVNLTMVGILLNIAKESMIISVHDRKQK